MNPPYSCLKSCTLVAPRLRLREIACDSPERCDFTLGPLNPGFGPWLIAGFGAGFGAGLDAGLGGFGARFGAAFAKFGTGFAGVCTGFDAGFARFGRGSAGPISPTGLVRVKSICGRLGSSLGSGGGPDGREVVLFRADFGTGGRGDPVLLPDRELYLSPVRRSPTGIETVLPRPDVDPGEKDTLLERTPTGES
jgi:hypothetical protein